jgi:transcriptional regulator with XRE-family HTH domain
MTEPYRIAVAERIRSILSTRNLTLYKASAFTRADHPGQSSYHIPRNLYFHLRSLAWSPTIQQLLALAQLSGYRLVDWLAVFGFRLDDVSRLQLCLRQPRTVRLDSTVYAVDERIPWFRDRSTSLAAPPIAPLSQLLERAGSQPMGTLTTKGPSRYLYAKIGQQDAYAFPDLAPGSIVRVDTRFPGRSQRKANAELSKVSFLVEHSRGLCCCRLHFGAGNRITLRATELAFANVELQLGSEAQILGVVDMEVRSLANHQRPAIPRCAEPEVGPDLTRLWTPTRLDQGFTTKEPAFRIRNARRQAGLSLRQASEMSHEIARAFEDRRYFSSPGSLSEYEATNTPPRHIHKLFTLSILYSIRFGELLDWFGLGQGETRLAAIPAECMGPAIKSPARKVTPIIRQKKSVGGFLGNTLDRLGELPLFLRASFPFLSGLEDVSLRDIYWVGGQQEAMHPLLNRALFVILDRRKRRPRILPHKSAWEQPLYLLTKRDGSYLMASCGMEDGAIVLHPYTDKFIPPQRFRKSAEAEVVGQIVTVVRSLLWPP